MEVIAGINIIAEYTRIFRDNIDPGDDFQDGAGTSGDDGVNSFSVDWDELDGGGGGGETDGESGGDVQILINSGREVIRIRDDNGQGNGRGEGIGRGQYLHHGHCLDHYHREYELLLYPN